MSEGSASADGALPEGRPPLWARLVGLVRSPTAAYGAAAVLGRANAFLLIPLYVKHLTVVAYGQLALVQTLIAFAPIVLGLGLVTALPQVFVQAADPDVGRARVAALARGIIATTVITTSLSMAIMGALSARLGLSLYDLGLIHVACAATAIGAITDIYLRYAQRAYTVLGIQIAQAAMGIAGTTVCMVFLHRGLRGALEGLTLGTLLSAVTALLIAFVLFPKTENALATVRSALPTAIPLLGHQGASWLVAAGDRWILKAYRLEAGLGSYALGSQLIAPASIFVTAWNETDAARMGAEYRTEGIEGLRKTLGRRRLRYALTALVPGVLMTSAAWLLKGFLPAGYGTALVVAPAFLLSLLIDSQYLPSSNFLYFAGKPKHIAAGTTIGGGAFLASAVLLAPAFGVAGVLAARIIGNIMKTSIVMLAAARTKEPGHER